MNTVFKIFLSMSFSGGLLIFVLLLGKPFLKNRISRQWQYYIWLAVVLRLLLPFESEVNLLGKAYQAVDQKITQITPLLQQKNALNIPGEAPALADDLEQKFETNNNENGNSPAEDVTVIHPLHDMGMLLINHVWLVWVVVALGLLIRKITAYQGFIRYIHAGMTSVSDIALLDYLSIIAKGDGIKKPIELCTNSLISSPLLIGFFHPCIVLPGVDIPEKNFQCIVLHELTHYKRWDMVYKWLIQITVCLHWFNPLVYLMSRELTKACEFSCDEAVLTKIGCDNARDYGKTLLDAMAEVGKYKENLGAVTLSENKQLLKERLGVIMNFERRSKTFRLLTGVLTLCIILGAALVGVYPTAAASNQPSGNPPVSEKVNSAQAGISEQGSKDYISQVRQCYEAGSLPLFEFIFPQLDETVQKQWLEKFYADGDFAFFSVAVHGLETTSSLFADFAEKAYADEEIAFFSIMMDCMDETEWKLWLDRALEDGKWNCQSILFDRLDGKDELEEQKDKEWAAARAAEYQAVGVTIDGRDYYYQGQLVNFFLDIRANKSFYTLNMNPAGIVHIKIIRGADNKITDVVYMTEAEVMELLGSMSDEDVE